MIKVKVLRISEYDPNDYVCEVVDSTMPDGICGIYIGKELRIDMRVSGKLPDTLELIGKIVKIPHIHGYVWIAEDQTIVDE